MSQLENKNELDSVFKGVYWMCCSYRQFEKLHWEGQVIGRLVWKSLLWFCRRRLHFRIYSM